MPFKSSSPYSLLADALRGVGQPFGGARRIEFVPALAGGIASAELESPSDTALEALEDKKARRELPADTPVLCWKTAGSEPAQGAIYARELAALSYEGHGLWQLGSGRGFRLLGDRQVVPATGSTPASRLLVALQGQGGMNTEANALVRLMARGEYEAICPISTFVAPTFEAVAADPGSDAVRAILESPQGKSTVLACYDPYREESVQFDLKALLDVKEPEPGIFELRGQRFAVLALRPVTPEVVQPSVRGYTLPLLDFRPPTATTH